jgi:hypothetical protein
VGSGLGAELAAGSAAGVSVTGLSGVAAGAAAGVSASGLRATVRFGAARFRLIALARPRVGFLAAADLPRRAAGVRRAAAVLRFVADPRFPAFLVLMVFAFDFRAVLAMTSPSLVRDDSLFCRSVRYFSNALRRVAGEFHSFCDGDGRWPHKGVGGVPSPGHQWPAPGFDCLDHLSGKHSRPACDVAHLSIKQTIKQFDQTLSGPLTGGVLLFDLRRRVGHETKAWSSSRISTGDIT